MSLHRDVDATEPPLRGAGLMVAQAHVHHTPGVLAAKQQAFWNAQQFRHPRMVVFFGCADGDHIAWYFQHLHRADRLVLIIEHSASVMQSAAARHDWSAHQKNPAIEWCVGESLDSLERRLRTYFMDVDRLCAGQCRQNVIWTEVAAEAKPYYLQAAQSVAHALEFAQLHCTGPADGHFRGLLNLIDNVPHLTEAPPFDALQGLFAGRPGIVVSSGPSLNATVAALRTVEDRAVIFACDSAVPALLRAEIQPHFIACLERVVATQHLMTVLPELPNSWLIFHPLVYRSTVASYRGPRLMWNTTNFPLQWLLGPTAPVDAGHSAATLAFRGLTYLGCGPIILAGQDLAFERETHRSHAAGLPEFLYKVGDSSAQAAQSDQTSWVTGNNGEPILSWFPYQLMSQDFSQMIAESGQRCINAIDRHYGMRIPGAEWMDPPAAMAMVHGEPLPVADMVRARLQQRDTQRATVDIAARLHAMAASMESLRTRALHELEMTARFFHEHLPSHVDAALEATYQQYFVALERRMNAVIQTDPAFQQLLSTFVLRDHIAIIGEYYRWQNSETPFAQRMLTQFGLLERWWECVALWASRVGALLAR